MSHFHPILDPRNFFALFDGFLFETLFDAREIQGNNGDNSDYLEKHLLAL